MAKIPFDIKYRPQIESGEYTVETRDGVHATILDWDIFIHGMAHMMLIRYNDKYEFVHSNGRINRTGQDCNLDLFIITPEEELSEFEIRLLDWLPDDTSGEIPMERMKEVVRNRAAELLSLAREQFIKDGYIIEKKAFHDAVEKVSPEVMKEVSENIDNEITQLTEFERAFDQFAEAYHSDSNPDDVACCKEYATKLLSIAEKELSAKYRFSSDLNGFAYGKGYEDGKKEAEGNLTEQIAKTIKDFETHVKNNEALLSVAFIEGKEKAQEDMKEDLRAEYEKGRAEALKDLPRWRKCNQLSTGQTAVVIGYTKDEDALYRNGRVISLLDLEKLPGFKSED